MTDNLQPLDETTCLDLVRGVPVGRIAWAESDGRVSVLPVNFALDGNAIVFSTAEGAKLNAVREGRLLTFEADEFEPALRTAWSVLITGTAEIVTDPEEIRRLRALSLAPWTRAPENLLVRLTPRTVTGRRIPLHPGGVTRENLGTTDDLP
ncbi:pyridoxamine 5'-phosphate oxidase family protein [Actinomadura macra]|uniref:pyridoxamine 5'-phosphate oxidase family protein n=1 Tax=Actinomadura macra TaxID=46164 RepID=UPI000834AACE|nr:pyridoxamine 5'-phosphate oxidase family protein [Actinomadura macra]